MPYTVVLHIMNEDSVVGEMERLPAPTDSMVTVSNPRRLDGKDLHFLAENVLTVTWPVHRINFIEIMASGEEEEIFGFVRE
jgi:hypothetical protein